jgi:hypothetical protein
MLGDSTGPIKVGEAEWLFYEPFCQLMRQTLLAWCMTKAGEFGASDWIHVHVIPEGNRALRMRAIGCAPALKGESVADAWRSILREPERYRVMTPTDIVGREVSERCHGWRDWLADRYGT